MSKKESNPAPPHKSMRPPPPLMGGNTGLMVDKDFMIRIDSLLSCLVHRHGNTLVKIGEFTEIQELAAMARRYDEEAP